MNHDTNGALLWRLRLALSNAPARGAVHQDLIESFCKVGIGFDHSSLLTNKLIQWLEEVDSLAEIEFLIQRMILEIEIPTSVAGSSAILAGTLLEKRLANRTTRNIAFIREVLDPTLLKKVVHISAGESLLAHQLSDEKVSIGGYDIVPKAEEGSCNIEPYCGQSLPSTVTGLCSSAIVTNVLRWFDQESTMHILAEVRRVLTPGGKALIIETVAEGEEQWCFYRAFLHDYFTYRALRPTHKRMTEIPAKHLSSASLTNMFRISGFKLVDTLPTKGFPNPRDLEKETLPIHGRQMLYVLERA